MGNLGFLKTGLKVIVETKVEKRKKSRYLLALFLAAAAKTFSLKPPIYKIKRNKVLINNPVGKFFVDLNTDGVTKSSHLFEYYMRNLFIPGKGGIFLDIGSNIGFYSIYSVLHNGYKKVHAFEPNPKVYEILQKNINLNNLDLHITAHNVGLSDKRASEKLLLPEYHTGASKINTNNLKNPKTEKEIIVMPLDSFSSEIPFKEVEFIKIDVEGFEYKVLQGMKKVLAKTPKGCYLLIEILPNQKHKEEIVKLLEKFSFDLIKKRRNNYLFHKKSNTRMIN